MHCGWFCMQFRLLGALKVLNCYRYSIPLSARAPKSSRFRTVERCFALKSRMLPIPRKSNLPPHFCTNPGSESGLARVQQETDNMTQTPGKSKKSKREVKDRLKAASSCLSGRTGKSLRDVALSRKTLGARFIIAMLLNVKLATNEA